ncbi:MAG: MFS transporter [Methylobacteriaceae bacterium]|nr:MFS transporter [Methylobacteriaceae bacterium]
MAAAPLPILSPGRTLLFAAACGAAAANMYYAQPLIGLIAPSVGLPAELGSLIVTLSQIGYAIGLVLLVPLGDLVENRRLAVVTLVATSVAVFALSRAGSPAEVLTAAAAVGLTAVVVQMLVPFAAHLAPEASRGAAVGNVTSGLVLGILLARPVASLGADLFGWRTVFVGSALLTLALAVILALALPYRRPEPTHSYVELLRSMGPLLRRERVLQRRIVIQCALFANFSLFWTAVPLELAGPPYELSQRGIALFGLAGAMGVLITPLAGRLADRGHGPVATRVALALAVGAFALAWAGPQSVILLAITAITLDAGVQLGLVTGQREIYALQPQARSRLNGIFIASFFAAGAVGSALASPVYEAWDWPGIAAAGLAIALAGLVFVLLTGRRAAP